MPDEEKDVEVAAPPPPAKKFNVKKIALIGGLVILGLALAAGISPFVITKGQ